MPIRYKVVTGDRKSCITKLFNTRNEPIPIARTYEKGKLVEADPKTLGIFVSETREQAKDFLFSWHDELEIRGPNHTWKSGKVLKVEAHGRG